MNVAAGRGGTGAAAAAAIPAFNEADRIGATVRAALAIDGVARVLVVDDGSTDDTAAAARAAGAEILQLERNHGKGGALNRAVETLKAGGAEAFLLLDADLGECAAEAGKILRPVLEGRADLAIGRFSSGGGFGIALKAARLGVFALTGRRVAAPLSGQRALNRAALNALAPFEPGYGMETAMTIDAFRAGLRVVEVPVDMTHRIHGRTAAGFAHRGRQGIAVLKAIVRRVISR